MKPIPLDTRPVSSALGEEVMGIDLREELTDGQKDRLRSLLVQRSLLRFRNQDISVEDQIRLVSLFGPVGDEQEDGSYHSYVSNSRADGLAGDARLPFHSDFTYTPAPHLVLSLYGEQVEMPTQPTWFASRSGAAAALPPDLYAEAADLDVVHARDLTPERRASYERVRLIDLPVDAPVSLYPRATHRLIEAGPNTGRPLLFVDEHFMSHIPGREGSDGEALLQRLLEYLVAPSNMYRHDWRPGDLVVWDNLTTVHARHSLKGAGVRTLRRVVISQATTSEMYQGAATRKGGLRFATR
jgi:taurine dioxygenase